MSAPPATYTRTATFWPLYTDKDGNLPAGRPLVLPASTISSLSLESLSDVSVTNPSSGTLIQYNTASSKWVTLPEGTKGQILTPDGAADGVSLAWYTPSQLYPAVFTQLLPQTTGGTSIGSALNCYYRLINGMCFFTMNSNETLTTQAQQTIEFQGLPTACQPVTLKCGAVQWMVGSGFPWNTAAYQVLGGSIQLQNYDGATFAAGTSIVLVPFTICWELTV